MVFHHFSDLDGIIQKLVNHLNPGGYLFIADLMTEDGSFHKDAVVPHHGFDPAILANKLSIHGLKSDYQENIFEVKGVPIAIIWGQKPK